MKKNPISFRLFPLFLALFFLNFSACETGNSAQMTQPNEDLSVKPVMELDTATMELGEMELITENSFPYKLDEPTVTIELPKKLTEISGLGINETGTHLYAVQDEEGKIFKINLENQKVEKEIEFHKDGDYEGIELVKESVFVVKSSGTIYEVKNCGEKNQEVIKHKFELNKNSDVEGLGYDPIDKRLLLSCKGKVGKGDEFDFKKGIYGLDLATMKLEENPAYTISLDSVTQFLSTNTALEKMDKLIKLFKPEEEFIFGPSGIAVHPKTGDVYVLSSVGKLLVILTHSGTIKHMVKLKKKVHEQPEGITFDQDGTLYISNEGKAGKGKIYKFVFNE